MKPAYLSKKVIFCLLAIFLPFIGQAQVVSGTLQEIKTKLEMNFQANFRLEGEDSLVLRNEEGISVRLDARHKKEIQDENHYYGKIKGFTTSSFRIFIKGDKLEGVIVDNHQHKAYTLSSNRLGQVELNTTDIGNVICTEYDTTGIPTPEAAVPGSTSSVYTLQSNPTSKSVAYLDFDGQVVEGTLWAGGATINAVPGNFSETDIQNIFKLVSEDYAAFNINITTDVNVYNAATRTSRMRCIMTPTNTASPGAGGVAYINSFTWGDGTPCWVFNSGAKAAGEAASHEIGHTLGLRHDGRTTPKEDYFAGQGNWAPIMGVGYSKSIVQWSIGEYNNANNTQDDINVISTRNGFSFRTDDHGNTIATATALVLETNGSVLAANNKGIIERRTDVDVFSFTTTGGNVSFTASPAASYPNLDINLELLNAQNTVISSANPTGLAATLSYNLAAGTYYLRLDGVGYGLPASTGYSDYSSLGAFSLTGNVPNSTVANILPNVSISSPTSGAVYFATASLVLQATASDLDGTIQKVEFFNGTTKLGEDVTSPYEFTWANVAIGNYNITAKATDNKSGVTTSSIVNVIVRKTPCSVANATVLYDKVIGTEGSNNNAGNSREFAFDEDSSTYFDAPTANGNWTGLELDGIYRITGIRYYPRSTHLSRMNGGKFQGSNTPDFSAGVVDLATITSSPANEWNCLTISNQASFKYVRYLSPNNGYCNVSEIEFHGTKTPNQSPTVRITSPTNRAVFYVPSTLTATVTGADADGSVVKVELYDGARKIGEDLTSPYQFTAPMDTAKKWVLIAKVIDNVGEYTLSDTVFVSAKNPLCQIPGVASSGTALGTTGSFNNSGATREMAFDKDSSTYFDAPNANSSWVGLDLGSAKSIVGVRFYPRLDYQTRMLNGRFQVATNAAFTQGVINIDTVFEVVNDEWNCINFPKAFNNRYIRYLSGRSSYCNIAELEVYVQNGSVTGLEDGDMGSQEFQLFPNPANNYVSIVTNNEIEKVVLSNVQGVILKEYSNATGPLSLPQELGNGFYHMALHYKNGEKTTSKLLILK